MIGAGLTVTFASALVGFYFGTKVLKMNPALLLESVTGAMTSTPALGYSGTYTIANVLLTFAGTIMAML